MPWAAPCMSACMSVSTRDAGRGQKDRLQPFSPEILTPTSDRGKKFAGHRQIALVFGSTPSCPIPVIPIGRSQRDCLNSASCGHADRITWCGESGLAQSSFVCPVFRNTVIRGQAAVRVRLISATVIRTFASPRSEATRTLGRNRTLAGGSPQSRRARASLMIRNRSS